MFLAPKKPFFPLFAIFTPGGLAYYSCWKERGLLLIFIGYTTTYANQIFGAHDDNVMCVDIDTHILVLHSPTKKEHTLKVA